MVRSPLLVLLMLLLAGCAAPPAPDDSYQGTCPAWVHGLGGLSFTTVFHPNSTKERFVDAQRLPLNFSDRPLDRVQMDFRGEQDEVGNWTWRGVQVADARLIVRFFDNQTQTPLEAYYAVGGPTGTRHHALTFDPGVETNFTLYIDLARPDQEPRPRIVDAVWTIERDLDQDPDTVSYAFVKYRSSGFYRTCGAP